MSKSLPEEKECLCGGGKFFAHHPDCENRQSAKPLPEEKPEKKCPKCKKVKSRADFYLNKTSKDGLAFYCAPCQSAASIAYRRGDTYHRFLQTKRRTNPQFKIGTEVRSRLCAALLTDMDLPFVEDSLGCTLAEFRAHMEKQFKPGMMWENHGRSGWHIDHIIPLKSFDLTNRKEYLKACHYSNLQPLWASDNIKKSTSTQENIIQPK